MLNLFVVLKWLVGICWWWCLVIFVVLLFLFVLWVKLVCRWLVLNWLGSRLLIVMLCVMVWCDRLVMKLVRLLCVLLDSVRMLIGVFIVDEVMLMMWLKLCVIIVLMVVWMSVIGVSMLVFSVVI